MSLFDKRLILVCGKGGVGRSTVAAAIAHECARRGKKTLLFEANANDRFGDYFGKPAVGTMVTELAPNLSAVNTNAATALAEYGMMILKFKTVYEMVFENRLTKSFLRAIPGLDEYAILGKAWFHTTEAKHGKPMWDTVIFDMPASGHSVSMLKIPWVIIDTVPEGPLTRDARTMQALFRDPARTAAVLVTLAEEMPVNEARELEQKLTTNFGIAPQAIVVNQIFPTHFPPASPASKVLDALLAAPGDATLAALAAHSAMSRSRSLLNQHYLAELADNTSTPLMQLPMMFVDPLGRPQIDALAEALNAADAAPC